MSDNWALAAACRRYDPELWFSDNAEDQATAIAVCTGCPARWDCMDDAVRSDDSTAYGIRAGLTGRQRTAMRRDKERAAA